MSIITRLFRKGRNMDDAVRYIEKVVELYGLSEDIKRSLLANADKIAEQLADYSWSDIEYAIDWYYTHKDGRQYPRVLHIKAVLNSDRKVEKNKPVANIEEPQKPYTNIRMIQDVFYDVCKIGHQKGVFNIEYFTLVEKIPAGWHTILVNDERGNPVIKEKRWYWEDAVLKARSLRPEVFSLFKNMTFLEECAMAYKLDVLKIKRN